MFKKEFFLYFGDVCVSFLRVFPREAPLLADIKMCNVNQNILREH